MAGHRQYEAAFKAKVAPDAIRHRGMAWLLGLAAILIAMSSAMASTATDRAVFRDGALLLMGGGDVTPEIARRFVELAGGRDKHFVYIPTAAPDSEIEPAELAAWFRTTFGVDDVTILHTRDRRVADTEAFVTPLETANGVWFGGGRQWRLADAYLDTSVEAALRRVLQRHGVVAGTSAGASILASYLVRGAPEGNWIVSAPGHERGFGLLPMTLVDQHVDRYHRETDIESALKVHGDLVGIGLDESTAIAVVRGRGTVIGRGRVILHDGKPHDNLRYVVLHNGDHFKAASGL
jgi:cyanophycinase